MTSDCKVLEKYKKCRCNKKPHAGLAEKLPPHRPSERVVERVVVERLSCTHSR